eukprot:Hpha_TRINITY_DN14982_c4_g13::TRINITY_DN14982_c4_g13_i3::g.143395::m.143395
MSLGVSVVFLLDALVRFHTAYMDKDALVTDRQQVRKHFWTFWSLKELACIPPYDSIAYLIGFNSSVWKALSILRLVRLGHVDQTFSRSNLPVLTPRYVVFNFVHVPRFVGMFWAMFSLHILVCLKLLFRDANHPDDSKYDLALFWVWNLLTTSPAPLTLYGPSQRWLCLFLMICGVFFQGIIIGKLSYEFLRQSIQDQNLETMRSTLQIIEQYKVPTALQEEVLSLQWHALQSSLSIAKSDVLGHLPEQMRLELLMYMKIDFVEKVPMFTHATPPTKVLLAAALQQEFVPPGQVIIKHGDVGREMYFILHGYCDVIIPGPGSVGQLSRGSFFGEVALLTMEPRGATIQALTYCDLLKLNKEDFDEVCAGDRVFQEMIVKEAEPRAMTQNQPNQARRISAAGRRDTGQTLNLFGGDPPDFESEWHGPDLSEGTQSTSDVDLVRRIVTQTRRATTKSSVYSALLRLDEKREAEKGRNLVNSMATSLDPNDRSRLSRTTERSDPEPSSRPATPEPEGGLPGHSSPSASSRNPLTGRHRMGQAVDATCRTVHIAKGWRAKVKAAAEARAQQLSGCPPSDREDGMVREQTGEPECVPPPPDPQDTVETLRYLVSQQTRQGAQIARLMTMCTHIQDTVKVCETDVRARCASGPQQPSDGVDLTRLAEPAARILGAFRAPSSLALR